MPSCPKISDIKNKQVLVRVDFNVPLKLVSGKANTQTAVWRVADSQRLLASLETINFLIDHGAKVVLMSHLGRPKGEVKADLSLAPVARFLKNNLDLPVEFINDCIGENVAKKAKNLKNGHILLLENLRFYAAEKKNEKSFAKKLVTDSGAEVFINEAFSACHRAHASVVGVPELLPHFAGFNLAREIKNFNLALKDIKRPLVLVMGGAKIADKIITMKHLARLADIVLTGGGIANALLKAGGIETHHSFVGGEESVKLAKEIVSEHATERFTFEDSGSERKNLPLPKVVLPIDVLAAKNAEVKDREKIEKISLLHDVADTDNDRDLQYLDIGPETVRLYRYILKQAKTIVWNGPMGVFENPLFAKGSRGVARAIASASDQGSISLVGGGESNSVISRAGLHDSFTHVSTAGGAALEFLSGKTLPGIKVLDE